MEIRKIIALLEIIAGVSCILEMFFILIASIILRKNYFGSIYGVIFYILFISLSVVTFIAGVLLWRNHSLGTKLSIVIQGLQILQIKISNFVVYSLTLGLGIMIYVEGESSKPGILKPGIDLKSLYCDLNFKLNSGAGFFIAFNLISVFAFIYLVKKYQSQKQHQH